MKPSVLMFYMPQVYHQHWSLLWCCLSYVWNAHVHCCN